MDADPSPQVCLTISTDGPYLVSGAVPLAEQFIVVNAAGESIDVREGRRYPAQASCELCRCGASGHKPFCDGTHATLPFDGTTTAPAIPYLQQAETIEGPVLAITDARSLCANARFCDRLGGIWALVKRSDDPEVRLEVEFQAHHCPSGRLIAWERASGRCLEPHDPPSIGLLIDTARGVDGPLWLRGGIPVISEQGVAYEGRQQCTLCRCGRSANKPFCDGSHAP